jgi:tRNA nucleotidyltransferase (CCA-adding enzyme)
MDLIVTRAGADFDGLASMIAAKKLYPEAELVLNGEPQPGVRTYLAQEFRHIYGIKQPHHIIPSRVRRLILVDTRQAEHLGVLAACLRNPNIELHIYDHHRFTSGGLRGNLEEIHSTGSTTAMLADILRKRGIIPDPDEASLMMLGIYEGTGGFLHASTSPDDLLAAAWLLQRGASLDVAAQFASRNLTSEQLDLLTLLQREARSYVIHDVAVVISALTDPNYMHDFSLIAQQLMVTDNIDALFALICLGERISLIARSRIPEVNAGVVARELGGGGHASAASATIYDLTIAEAEEELVNLLHRHVRPKTTAAGLMSSPVIAVTGNVQIREANQLMTRYNITVLPVAKTISTVDGASQPEELLGMLSRTVAEKAIFHQLGHLPVAEYMTTEIATLPESATLADIQRLIVERRQRLIPIVRGKAIVGVLTRTDLLRLLSKDPGHLSLDLLGGDELPSTEQTRNLAGQIAKVLPRKSTILLREIGETAADLGCNAYVAGGFVRDLLLQIANNDIDIVIEGDGIAFAEALAKSHRGIVHPHEKFGTATVSFPDQTKVDVATARLEFYDRPAALPEVEHSSIKLDLYRRDFTINAMAVHLNPDKFGELVDYFGGQNDLLDRRIHVLHNLSLVEDPTRIFRAIRFEARLDFVISSHTAKLIRNAVRIQLLDRVDAVRCFRELKLILSEDNPLPALRRMAAFDLLPVLWSGLKQDRRLFHTLQQAHKAISWFRQLELPDKPETWMVYLLALMHRATADEFLSFCDRFSLSPRQRRKLHRQKKSAEAIAATLYARPPQRPSEIHQLLLPLDIEGILYLMAIARRRSIQQAAALFVTSLRTTTPLLDGADLKAMGYTPGPQFKTILNQLLQRRLDGAVTNQDEARAFVREHFAPLSRARQS